MIFTFILPYEQNINNNENSLYIFLRLHTQYILTLNNSNPKITFQVIFLKFKAFQDLENSFFLFKAIQGFSRHVTCANPDFDQSSFSLV